MLKQKPDKIIAAMEDLPLVIETVPHKSDNHSMEISPKILKKIEDSFQEPHISGPSGLTYMTITAVVIIGLLLVAPVFGISPVDSFFGRPTPPVITYSDSGEGYVLGESVDNSPMSVTSRLIRWCQESVWTRNIC